MIFVNVRFLLFLGAMCLLQNMFFGGSSYPDVRHLKTIKDVAYGGFIERSQLQSDNDSGGPTSRARTNSRRDQQQATTDVSQEERRLPERLPFRGKRGVCLSLRDEDDPKGGTWVENLPKLKKLNPYWNYSWSTKRIAKQPAKIEFVPMVWGAWSKEGMSNSIKTDIIPQIEAGQAKRLLVFNEPDRQSGVPVESAIDYWPLAQATGLELGSPACVGAKNWWMTDFVDRLKSNTDRHMDYITVHWYGGADVTSFKREMNSIYEYYGKKWPLWITEFAPADWKASTPADNKYSQAQVLAFMKEALPWLERQDFIAAYSWFSFDANDPPGACSALFKNGTSYRTALGKFYASITNENPDGNQTIPIE